MELFSKTMQSLEYGLSYASQKQKVISQNIANVDTPNYKAQDLSFKSALHQAMNPSMTANRTDNRHYHFTNSSRTGLNVHTRKDIAYHPNGNSVDIDKEMSEMAQNQIYYEALVERLSGKFNSLRTVVQGGK
ncbi:flagellar basal body rod protein FlgB [Bacillus sp. CGMCC 1.16541]|uniref:flagellar basal body rod protein FlgB n=1 Tax=Bacillus sp. CGMCC 1.16541 TaxID=2185143 RepID=UPI000D72B064|nr:flagellar basal body rod protein FlgB [Bacillus sp. CGMCC 1.16541]